MNKNADNFRRSKKKNNQMIYVVAVAILMVISVVIAVVSASNRKKPGELTPPTNSTAPATLPETKPDAPSTNAPITSDPTAPTTPPTEEAKPTAPSTDSVVTAPATEETPVIATLPDFSAPSAGIVAKAHSESTPVFSTTMNDYRVHTGIDVQGSIGSPVLATADGTVSQIWNDPMMGKCISISHSGGAVSIYKNLGEELPASVTIGASVKQGDVVGAIGESALIEIADEPHVHYELKIANVYVNPEDYIDFSDATVNFEE